MISKLIKNNLSFFRMIIVAGFVFGLMSFFDLPKEPDPSINIPMYAVTIPAPGLDPDTVEQQITNKLEQKFKSITDIKKITSQSTFNFSVILVEFNESKDNTDAINDLKSGIDQEFSSFPQEVKYPLVKKINFNDIPIYTFSIYGNYDSSILYSKTQKLEDSLKSISGVSDVIVNGKPQKSINIFLDYDKLSKFNIDFGLFVQLVKTAFFRLPLDKKMVNEKLYSYEYTTYENSIDNLVDKILNFDILNINGESVKISDLGEVYYEQKVHNKKSFVVDKTNNSTFNAITYEIKRTPGSDLYNVINLIEKEIEKFMINNKDINYKVSYTKSSEIEDVFGTFVENFWQTGIIILIVIFVFLGIKPGLGIGITFPLVYFMTFIYLNFLGYTFNTIVSFALVLTLGIMVDNLIVITEGIINQKNNGVSNFWEALKNTQKKFIVPLIAGTGTTIAMFISLYFGVSGIVGNYIKGLPVTIIGTLIVSLLISFFLLPPILFVFLKNGTNYKKSFGYILLDKIGNKIALMAKFIIQNKLFSGIFVLFFWILLVSGFALVALGIVKTDFMAGMDTENVWINIKYKAGIDLSKNQEYTNIIKDDILSHINKEYGKSLDFVTIYLGGNMNTSPLEQATNLGSENESYFAIKLLHKKSRKQKSYIISQQLNHYIQTDFLHKYDFIQDAFSMIESGMGGGKPISFFIVGQDLKVISDYYDKLLPELKKIDGMYNISSSLEYTNGKIKYIVDVNKAKELGINSLSSAYLLAGIKNSNYYPYGIQLSTYNEFDKDPIEMKAFVNYSGDINTIKIGDNYFESILEKQLILAEIKSLQHIDGELSILVSADKLDGIPLGDISEKINSIINKMNSDSVKIRYSSDLENQEESIKDLGNAFLVGLGLMFMVLVLQFNSFKNAIIILTSTLLSLIGVFYLLALFDLPFSFPAQIGLFGVIGVGVNNAILFIESFLSNQKNGLNLDDSLILSIQERFSAIFLTTFTTIVGLINLAIKDEVWGSLALAFIGGLLINVLIILLYLPALLKLISKNTKNS